MLYTVHLPTHRDNTRTTKWILSLCSNTMGTRAHLLWVLLLLWQRISSEHRANISLLFAILYSFGSPFSPNTRTNNAACYSFLYSLDVIVVGAAVLQNEFNFNGMPFTHFPTMIKCVIVFISKIFFVRFIFLFSFLRCFFVVCWGYQRRATALVVIIVVAYSPMQNSEKRSWCETVSSAYWRKSRRNEKEFSKRCSGENVWQHNRLNIIIAEGILRSDCERHRQFHHTRKTKLCTGFSMALKRHVLCLNRSSSETKNWKWWKIRIRMNLFGEEIESTHSVCIVSTNYTRPRHFYTGAGKSNCFQG